MRVLFRFGKLDRLRFISHLDLQRFMQMALRRTELPVAYSQGFNPHPAMAFASALAMGWTSEAEILDVKLAEGVEAAFAEGQMRRALPPDMPLYEVKLVDDRHPKLMAMLESAEYSIRVDGVDAQALDRAVKGFLAEERVVALRKTKSGEKPTDIRPMCEYLFAKQTDSGCEISARLALTEKATLKPDLLLCVLSDRIGCEAEKMRYRIHRKTLLGKNERGETVPLMQL